MHPSGSCWSFTNLARMESASFSVILALADFLNAGSGCAGRRSPGGFSALILWTLFCTAKVNFFRVASTEEDLVESPDLTSWFFPFMLFSAFFKDLASGLLCLRAGSGVLHRNLLSGAAGILPEGSRYLAKAGWLQDMVAIYHQKHSNCLQDCCISWWDVQVGWPNTIFHGQPLHGPWSDGSSAPQNKQELVGFQTHEISREITGFSRFFHVSRVVLGYPIFALKLNFLSEIARLQFKLQIKKGSIAHHQEALRSLVEDWHAWPIQCPGLYRFGYIPRDKLYFNPIWTSWSKNQK